MAKAQRYDKKFIDSVAYMVRGIKNLSVKDAKRAHKFASKYTDGQDYYDALKEFFR
jgi:hypothetical protein